MFFSLRLFRRVVFRVLLVHVCSLSCEQERILFSFRKSIRGATGIRTQGSKDCLEQRGSSTLYSATLAPLHKLLYELIYYKEEAAGFQPA